MSTLTNEFIWEGRLHLGDQPGVYGDATYAGLAIELPVTLTKSDPTNAATIIVHAESVQTMSSYPGHLVTVVSYQDGVAEEIGHARIHAPSDNQTPVEIAVSLDLSNVPSPGFAGVRIQIDTTVPPGLYDDFVISGLALDAPNNAVVGELGFHS